VILTVALPLICSAYIGVAEAAAEKALASAKRKGNDGVNVPVIGEMRTELTTAQIARERMIANVDELNVEPGIEYADRSLIRKTIVTEAVKRTAEKALEATGGRLFSCFWTRKNPARRSGRTVPSNASKEAALFHWLCRHGLGPHGTIARETGSLGRCGSVVSSTEPRRELPAKVSSTEDGQRASGRGIADREVAETDICKGPEIGNNFEIDSESRIEEAHVNLWPVEDEPVTPLRCLPKLKKNYGPVIRQIFLPH
jgi:hypothetical protein